VQLVPQQQEPPQALALEQVLALLQQPGQEQPVLLVQAA
jgi:hypothetical protein